MKKASKRQQISKLDSIFHATKNPESVTYFKISVCIVISLFFGVSLNSVEMENFVLTETVLVNSTLKSPLLKTARKSITSFF